MALNPLMLLSRLKKFFFFFLEGVGHIWVLKNERYLTPIRILLIVTSQLTDVRHVWMYCYAFVL